MPSRQVEVERKYDVDAQVALPDLRLLPKVAGVEPVLQSTLDAVYSDTPDLALADAGITLRRRTGGSDAGWHLKVPRSGDDRAELAEPLRDDENGVPAELLQHIRGWVRDAELRPVATLSTRRVVHRLVGKSGRVLAEVSDDIVTATAIAMPSATGGAVDAPSSTWREWEIELVDGSRKLLAAAEDLFAGAGASRSTWPSKLHHALNRHPSPVPAGSAPRSSSDPGRESAGRLMAEYLAVQFDVIVARDPDVRSNEPDAVHKVRVATRRMRSILSSFRPMFDRKVTDPIREELKWFAGILGAARDVEVQREHLRSAAAAEPADLVLGPVLRRIEADLGGADETASRRLREGMSSPRYFRLLDTVEALVRQPPLTELATGKARTVLGRSVRSACKDLYRLAGAEPPVETDERDHWLHEIRKSAKRVRYAAEMAEPALGKAATVLAASATAIQEILGDHQDSVVIRATLRAMAIRMHQDGENAFTVGRLHALQQVRADAAEAAFGAAWSGRFAAQVKGWRKR